MRNRLLLVLLLGMAGCSSVAVRGAEIARSNAEPGGPIVARYAAAACRDARGNAAPLPPGLHVLVEEEEGHPKLWVRRAGYDTLVIRSSFMDAQTRVFQALLDGSGPPVLHEFRLPSGFAGAGRLALAREFEEQEAEPWRFKARPGPAVLVCALALEQPAPPEAEQAVDGGSG